jgi:hypothetical protein
VLEDPCEHRQHREVVTVNQAPESFGHDRWMMLGKRSIEIAHRDVVNRDSVDLPITGFSLRLGGDDDYPMACPAK